MLTHWNVDLFKFVWSGTGCLSRGSGPVCVPSRAWHADVTHQSWGRRHYAFKILPWPQHKKTWVEEDTQRFGRSCMDRAPAQLQDRSPCRHTFAASSCIRLLLVPYSRVPTTFSCDPWLEDYFNVRQHQRQGLVYRQPRWIYRVNATHHPHPFFLHLHIHHAANIEM